MIFRTLLPLITVAVVCTSAFEVRHVRSSRAPSIAPVELPQAKHVVHLTEKTPRPSHKKQMLRQLRKGHSTAAPLTGTFDEEEYVTDITIGEQHFKAIIDTGSSDTWIVRKGFSCLTLDGTPQDPSQCFFGSEGFDPSKSKTFVPFPDTNFNVSYGDGETLIGSIGFDKVTIGGLTVERQEIGVPSIAAWEGDTINSGLIGIAYPDLTSAFAGNDPSVDGQNNSLPYSSFFFSAVQQGVVDAPVFSISLNRGTFADRENSTSTPDLGYLAFGGIVPVSVTNTSVTVPIQTFTTLNGSAEFFFYNVDIDKYVFPGSDNLNTTSEAILDTGTTLNLLPSPIAHAINAQFQPPPKFDEGSGEFIVDCKAKAPHFSVVIGGVELTVDTRDLIVPTADGNGGILCISGIADGGMPSNNTIFILGDVFLHNVISTFDIQANDVTLSQRVKY